MPVAVVAFPAIMAVLLILAAYLVVEFVGRTIGQAIPLPGLDQIVRWITRVAGNVINAMAGFLSDVARGIENLINVPVNAIRGIFQSIASALARFGAAIRYILYDAIPNIFVQMDALFFRALDYTRTLVVQFYNFAMEALANVEAYVIWRMDSIANYLEGVINWVFGTLSQAIQAALNAAINFAIGVYNTVMSEISRVEQFLQAEITNAVNALEQYARDLANWAMATAFNAAVAWAKSYADWAINIAQRDLDAIIAGEMGGIWDNILTMVQDGIDAVEGGVQWLQDRLNWLESFAPSGVLATILALAGAISIPIEWVARCGTKLCSSLGGFGNEMDNLADDAIIALIIAFAVAAASDPKGMADETERVAADGLRIVANGFRDMIHSL